MSKVQKKLLKISWFVNEITLQGPLQMMFSRIVGRQCVRSVRLMTTTTNIPQRLTGKVAIVTASTQGIGLAIARRLGREGAKVMISSRKTGHVNEAIKTLQAENLDVKGLVCHVGKAEHRTRLIEHTVEQFGQLDVLVSNAMANPHMGNILDSTEQQWDKLLDVNVKSAFLLMKEAVPHLEKTRGSVIFISSIAAYVPMELIGPYSVCKTALLGLVKALVPACAEKHIRVNGIAPGIIKTNFSQVFWSSESVEKEVLKQVPLDRLGMPDDIGNAAAFLASDDASYMTGETIVVAGGMQSHL